MGITFEILNGITFGVRKNTDQLVLYDFPLSQTEDDILDAGSEVIEYVRNIVTNNSLEIDWNNQYHIPTFCIYEP